MKIEEISLDTARRLFREELRKALPEEPNVRLAYQCFKTVSAAISLIEYLKTLDRYRLTWKNDPYMLELNDRLAQFQLDYILSNKFWS